MKISVEKKLATVGESSRNVAGQGKHTELHSATQFCIANERNASGLESGDNFAEVRRQVAYTLASLSNEERRAVLSNLYPFDNGDNLEVERQKLAAAMRGRFGIAGWIDDICSIWGWRFTGFSWVDLTGRWEDDLERGPDLEWLHPGDDNHAVRLVVGDEPQVFLSEDSGNTWTEISIDQLGDELGEWLAAKGVE